MRIPVEREGLESENAAVIIRGNFSMYLLRALGCKRDRNRGDPETIEIVACEALIALMYALEL